MPRCVSVSSQTFSLAFSSSLRLRESLTRTLFATLRTPILQICLFRPTSTRTSLWINQLKSCREYWFQSNLTMFHNSPTSNMVTYAVFICFSANCLISRIARGALFLNVTPYKRLLIWIVYSRDTMSLDFVLVSAFLSAFTILKIDVDPSFHSVKPPNSCCYITRS